jgi:hypothetical protein
LTKIVVLRNWHLSLKLLEDLMPKKKTKKSKQDEIMAQTEHIISYDEVLEEEDYEWFVETSEKAYQESMRLKKELGLKML